MLILSLVWLTGGVVVGVLGLAAGLRPARPGYDGPLQAWGLVGLGGVAGLAGGWMGTLVFGAVFGSPTACWVAVLAVVMVPWAVGGGVKPQGHAGSEGERPIDLQLES